MNVVLAFVVLIASQQSAPSRGPGGLSPCAVSDDPTYGWTRENAVPIGGGAMYVSARERRYLDALRGSEGQAVRYRRIGSVPKAPNDLTILDRYEVTYDGLLAPAELYLDAYHYWEPRAPKGLTCGQPINLQPTLDVFQATESLRSTALDQGATRVFEPIPLDADGSRTHGLVWDGFRTLAMAARTAVAAAGGKPSRPDGGTIVLAYPLSCDGRTVKPVAIDILTSQGQPLPRGGELVKGGALAALLPDTSAPADFTPPPLPQGANSAENRLLLQVLIDLDGRLQAATYVGGPTHLQTAALEAVKTWRAEPARINGSPVPAATLLEVRFR